MGRAVNLREPTAQPPGATEGAHRQAGRQRRSRRRGRSEIGAPRGVPEARDAATDRVLQDTRGLQCRPPATPGDAPARGTDVKRRQRRPGCRSGGSADGCALLGAGDRDRTADEARGDRAAWGAHHQGPATPSVGERSNSTTPTGSPARSSIHSMTIISSPATAPSAWRSSRTLPTSTPWSRRLAAAASWLVWRPRCVR